MGRRQRGDPHIDFVPGQSQGHSTILRDPFFSNVQARHDLDPRHQQGGQFTSGPEHFAQLPVDAHAYRQVLLESFQVHVRRVLAHRFAEQCVDQPDDRRVALLLQQVGGLRDLIDQAEQVQLFVQPLGNLLGCALTFAISDGQTCGEYIRLKHPHRQIPSACPTGFRQGRERRIGAQYKA
ncbi:hypothetical protein D3C84_696620 [compost metagenome]